MNDPTHRWHSADSGSFDICLDCHRRDPADINHLGDLSDFSCGSRAAASRHAHESSEVKVT